MLTRGGMFTSLCCAVLERSFYTIPYAAFAAPEIASITRVVEAAISLGGGLILLGLSCSCTHSGNALSSPLSPLFPPGALIDGQLCLQEVHSKDGSDLQQREGSACMPFLILLGTTRASSENKPKDRGLGPRGA